MSVRGQPQALQVDWRTTTNPDGSRVRGTVVDHANSRVFAASRSGRVTALSLSDGSKQWTTAVPHALETEGNSPLVYNSVTDEVAAVDDGSGGTILAAGSGDVAGSLPGEVRGVAHNADDGTWYGSVAVDSEFGDDLQIKAYDSETRDVVWVSPVFGTGAGNMQPAVGSSEAAGAIAGIIEEDVAAVNPDGTRKWGSDGPLVHRVIFLEATGDAILSGSRSSDTIGVISGETGGVLGTGNISELIDVAAFPSTAEQVYAASRGGVVAAFDKNAQQQWSENTGLGNWSLDVAVGSGDTVRLAVGDGSGRVTMFVTDHNPPPGAGDGDGGNGGGGDGGGPGGVVGGPGTLAVLLAGATTGAGATIAEQEWNLEQRFGGGFR